MDSGRAWILFGSRKNPKPRVREMLAVGAAESPASGVSMKAQSDGVAVGHVFGYACVCSENGNAYPGTLRKGQSKRAWEVPSSTRNQPAQVFDCPVRIRLTGKLLKAGASPYLCVIQRP